VIGKFQVPKEPKNAPAHHDPPPPDPPPVVTAAAAAESSREITNKEREYWVFYICGNTRLSMVFQVVVPKYAKEHQHQACTRTSADLDQADP
jgi:hypothetical protein